MIHMPNSVILLYSFAKLKPIFAANLEQILNIEGNDCLPEHHKVNKG